MNINLTNQEIADITCAKWHSKQTQVLAMMKIPYKIRPDGSPMVSRQAYEQTMGVRQNKTATRIEPDFASIG